MFEVIAAVKVTEELKQFRAMNSSEMRARRDELRKELLQLRTQKVTGQLGQTARLRQVRRQIARLSTLMAERES